MTNKFFIGLLFITLVTLTAFGQNGIVPQNTTKLVLYVEYGGKGIKLGVLAYTDKEFHKYTPVEDEQLNVGLSKAIQSTGKISPQDISSAVSSSYDAYQQFLAKYKSKGLDDQNVFFYTSSGLGVATNINELCDAIKAKTNHGVYVVKETEEAKYTIAGTIPFEKIDNALVLDQGGSNTKGGYIVKDGKRLTGVPTNFDLGSVRVADLIVSNYMKSQPDDANEYRAAFVDGMNRCFDSLKIVIKRTFSNIEGAESRDELYLSGGAAFAVTTLLEPDAPLNQQMVKIDYGRLKSFLDQVEDRSYYNSLKTKTFTDEKMEKNYKSALSIYTQLQLISATKLLVTFVGALGGDDKQIYFNRYGLHSMPSILIGRVERGDVEKW
jgi:exopolyphosphatase/pppGpp-phosphohydrolase